MKNPGRVAGLWYLVLGVLGPIRLMVIPSKLYVAGDATATANNILAHELFFRLGIAADLVGAVVLVFMSLAFYRLFKDVSAQLSVLVVIFGGVMPGLLYLVNATHDLGALAILHMDDLSVFDAPQRAALARLFLRLHGEQVTAAEVLWGVWLFPLAALVYRSRVAPRFLAIWLALAGCGWLLQCFTAVLLPESEDLVSTVMQPVCLGEVALMLWLVVKGSPIPVPATVA